jgi:hypothetical protein
MIRRSSTPDVLQTSLSIYKFKSALSRKCPFLPSHRSGVPGTCRSLAKICSYLIIIMNMCVVYWSEIHQLKYQRGFIFNGSVDPTLNGENMRFWLTCFIWFVFAHFLSIWHEEDIVQQLKAWSFRMWKNLVHTHSNSDTIARWSSITFFVFFYVFLGPISYIRDMIFTMSP